MAKARAPTHGHKVRISVTISPEVYEWVSKRVGSSSEFASVSHAVERALVLLRDRSR